MNQIRITAAVCSVIILTFHPAAVVRFVWRSFKCRLINYLRLTTSSGNTQPPRPPCCIYHHFLMFRCAVYIFMIPAFLQHRSVIHTATWFPTSLRTTFNVWLNALFWVSDCWVPRFNTNTSMYGLSFLMWVANNVLSNVIWKYSDLYLKSKSTHTSR